MLLYIKNNALAIHYKIFFFSPIVKQPLSFSLYIEEYTYSANKEVYSQFSNAKYKGKYRKEHTKEIQKYEEARDWLGFFYPAGKMTSQKTLTLQKEKLQQQITSEEELISILISCQLTKIELR